MPLLLMLLLMLALFGGAFGFMIYRHEADKRAREKRRNQYHDRV
jgi:preprotein translocase subunit YajC